MKKVPHKFGIADNPQYVNEGAERWITHGKFHYEELTY